MKVHNIKKGIKITKIEITKDNHVTVYGSDGNVIVVTRSQRNMLSCYKSKTYVDDIIKMFSNPEILSSDFVIYKNDEIVFHI